LCGVVFCIWTNKFTNFTKKGKRARDQFVHCALSCSEKNDISRREFQLSFHSYVEKNIPDPIFVIQIFYPASGSNELSADFHIRDLLLIRAIPRSFGIGDRAGLEICRQGNFQICFRLQLASDHSPRRGAKRIVIIRSVSVEMTLRRWPWKIIKATYARHMFPNGTRAD